MLYRYLIVQTCLSPLFIISFGKLYTRRHLIPLLFQIFDNTPAAKDATLAAGDEIVGVNGQSVKGRTKVEVARMIQSVKVKVLLQAFPSRFILIFIFLIFPPTVLKI